MLGVAEVKGGRCAGPTSLLQCCQPVSKRYLKGSLKRLCNLQYKALWQCVAGKYELFARMEQGQREWWRKYLQYRKFRAGSHQGRYLFITEVCTHFCRDSVQPGIKGSQLLQIGFQSRKLQTQSFYASPTVTNPPPLSHKSSVSKLPTPKICRNAVVDTTTVRLQQ